MSLMEELQQEYRKISGFSPFICFSITFTLKKSNEVYSLTFYYPNLIRVTRMYKNICMDPLFIISFLIKSTVWHFLILTFFVVVAIPDFLWLPISLLLADIPDGGAGHKNGIVVCRSYHDYTPFSKQARKKGAITAFLDRKLSLTLPLSLFRERRW